MRKIIGILSTMVAVFFCSITVLAGDINSAEQSLISAVSGTVEYMGSYYKLKSEYISQGISYLSRDNVNLTESQANAYISQFYSNIATGVNGGYMYKVGDVEPEPTPEPTPEQDPTQAPQSPADETQTGIEADTIDTYEVSTFEARDMYVWDTDRLKVYKEADETSDFIGLVFKGACVSVTGETTNGWMQIMHNGETGYVEAKFLRTYEYMVEIGEIVEEEEVSSEVTSFEEVSSEPVSSEELSTEEATTEVAGSEDDNYDYSDAVPLQNSVPMGLIAVLICAVVAAICVVIVWIHKKKNFKK